MSEAETNEVELDEEGLPIEGSNEPEGPLPPLEVPPDCPECPGGSPPWMATFADMATLLMAFFVLILSFANVNVPKFEQVSGSLAVAFGVERVVPKIKIPMAETLLSTEFTPADAEATVIANKKISHVHLDKIRNSKDQAVPLHAVPKPAVANYTAAKNAASMSYSHNQFPNHFATGGAQADI